MTKAIIFDVKGYAENEELLDLMRKFKERFLLVYFSNEEDEQARVNKDLGLYDIFSIVLLSSDFGVRKPDPQFYEILVDFLKDEEITPQECLFVDDLKVNLAPAENLGMKVTLYKEPKQLIAEI